MTGLNQRRHMATALLRRACPQLALTFVFEKFVKRSFLPTTVQLAFEATRLQLCLHKLLNIFECDFLAIVVLSTRDVCKCNLWRRLVESRAAVISLQHVLRCGLSDAQAK